jgi:hypothetical protein
MIEAALGVIAACLPTLRPLFKGWSVEDFLANMKSTFTLRSTAASSTWRRKVMWRVWEVVMVGTCINLGMYSGLITPLRVRIDAKGVQ